MSSELIMCSYFEIKVCDPPAVQVVEGFKNISEVESHLLLCQVSPAHYVVQEASLVGPVKKTTGLLTSIFRAMDQSCSHMGARLNSHLQDKNEAAERLVRVQQFDQVGMVQTLQEADLLQHLFSAQQLLVDVFRCHCPFAPSLVAPLDH